MGRWGDEKKAWGWMGRRKMSADVPCFCSLSIAVKKEMKMCQKKMEAVWRTGFLKKRLIWD